MFVPVHFRGVLALLIVTMVGGTTFPAMKDLSSHFSAVWIAFLRFAVGSMLLLPFLRKARRPDIVWGGVLGVTLFTAFMLQVEALGRMSANRNAFITGLNVLIVPILGLLTGRMPENRIIVAVPLAIAGLFAMCWDGGSWSDGDSLALCGALCFGVYVKLMETLTRRASDLMALTGVQTLTVACLAGASIAVITSQHLDIEELAQGVSSNIANLVYLGAFATAIIITLQIWGQRHSSANEAAIVYAFEPACAAIAAYFWLAETMTARSMFGGVLLVLGMIASQWTPCPHRHLR